jgi:hypothetical protein
VVMKAKGCDRVESKETKTKAVIRQEIFFNPSSLPSSPQTLRAVLMFGSRRCASHRPDENVSSRTMIISELTFWKSPRDAC